MDNARATRPFTDDFTLGTPSLVCRWRLASRELPLENRHLRALGQRLVCGRPVSPQLVAWAKQHIEWTLADGAFAHPDGVLMVVMDEGGRAAMTVGPYEPLVPRTASVLAERAAAAATEAERTGVAPESLWLVRGDALVWGRGEGERPSGTASLMLDLARTLGFPVERRACLAAEVLAGSAAYDEVFLASDEHGIVPASDAAGPRAERFRAGYEKLLGSRRQR